MSLSLGFQAPGCKVTMEPERRRWEQGKSNAPTFAVLTQIQTFFLRKCSSDSCKSLVNFKSSQKNIILTIFASAFTAFTEKQIWNSLLHHSNSGSPIITILPLKCGLRQASFLYMSSHISFSILIQTLSLALPRKINIFQGTFFLLHYKKWIFF